MPYLQKNNRELQNKKTTTLTILLFLFFLLWWSKKYENFLNYKSSAITTTIKISIEESVGKIYQIFNLFNSKEKLITENIELKKQLEILQKNNYLIEKNYQLSLKELNLAHKKENKEKLIGFVISKAPAIPFGYAMIDIGTTTGLEKGNLAFYNNFLIGEVTYVSNDHSLIKFFGYNKENVKLIIGENRIIKDGIGTGNGGFIFNLPQGGIIKNGEIVRIQNFSKYIFGETLEVGALGNAEGKEVFAQSPVNYLEVPFIEIIK